MTSRREFMRTLAVGAAAAAMHTTQPARAQAKKPNVVLIMADDLGYAELGSYGQKLIETPNLDRMAAEGMRFTQFYAGAPVCAPSRCNLMTGRHAGHAVVRNNFEIKTGDPNEFGGQFPLPPDEPAIAKTMKAHGYATGCFGKWGLGAPGSTGDPLNQGFDRFYGYNCQRHAHNLFPRFLIDDREKEMLPGNTRGQTGEIYGPQRIADEMIQFVHDHKDEPFFLYYPAVIPHLALQAPQEYIDRYKGRWEEEPYTGKSYQHHETPKSCYAAMITFLDEQVDRLFKTLDELGLDDDTIVIFTSDNGTTHLKAQVDYEFFNSVGPLRGLKGSVYEGGIRVPMIARWPGKIAPGTTSDHIAAHYDMPATIAETAGTEFADDTDSISLAPTLFGNEDAQEKHDHLFWDFKGYGGQIAVRMGKWKGVRRDLVKKPNAPLELYDLENDIGETKNVAAEHPEIAKRIASIMLDDRIKPDFEAFRFGEYGS